MGARVSFRGGTAREDGGTVENYEDNLYMIRYHCQKLRGRGFEAQRLRCLLFLCLPIQHCMEVKKKLKSKIHSADPPGEGGVNTQQPRRKGYGASKEIPGTATDWDCRRQR